MTRKYISTTILAALWLAAALAAGCVNVNAQAPQTIGTGPSTATTAAPSDGKSAAQLAQDNNSLRHRMEGLEKTNQEWHDCVEQKQEQLRQLESQRKEAQKERDRAKKAAGA